MAKLSSRLSFRQARNAVVIALVLGLIFTLAQITSDLLSEREAVDRTIHQVLETLEAPAAQAAYDVDRDLAQNVIESLLKYKSIHSAVLVDNFGDVLAARERPLARGQPSALGKIIADSNHTYRLELVLAQDGKALGELRVRVDGNQIVGDFFRRSVLNLLLGFIQALILALILFWVFYLTLTRPLTALAQRIAATDPTDPRAGAIDVGAKYRDTELGQLAASANNFAASAREHMAQRLAAEEAQAKSEERLRGAIESMQEGFALFDADDRLVAINEVYCQINPEAQACLDRGGTFEELIRANTGRGQLVEAAGREEEFIRERLERHKNPEGSIMRQVSDGSWYIIREMRTPEGGVALTFIDVTELKLAEEDRRRALVAAEQANQAKSEFLATMSHELRTPLNAIIGFAEILTKQYFGPPGQGKYREYAKDIFDSGHYLLSLVNDILDLSTIEAGKLELEFEMLNPGDLVEECSRIVGERARDKEIDLVTQVSADLPLLVADRRAIKQVLLNLLSNAVKFTPEGGTVTMAAAAADKKAVFSIADTGVGIPADRLTDLTKPFTTVRNNAYVSEDGWGLGLAIAKSLVELHEGAMDIESEQGKGTTITVSLPV